MRKFGITTSHLHLQLVLKYANPLLQQDAKCRALIIELFQVSIQSPDDFARTGRIGFLASPGTQIDAAVTGQTQIGDDKLSAINLDKRLCTTSGEIALKYFHDYTGPYCQLDCLTRFFLQDCKCVPFYYPGEFLKIFFDYLVIPSRESYCIILLLYVITVPDYLPVCNLSSYPCLQRVSGKYF